MRRESRRFARSAPWILLLVVIYVNQASAFLVNTTGSGVEIRWGIPSETYFINPAGGPEGAVSAIEASYQTWTDVATSAFRFVSGGTTTSDATGVRDGVNLVSFGPLESSSIAVTFTWYDTGTGKITDSDIRLSTGFSWSADGAPGAMDVRNIVTHESGHSLSLEDLFDPADSEKTMYAFASSGETKKRSLHPDDIAGITHLYPVPAATITVSSPDGGESWEQGSSHDILWSVTGDAGPDVRIELLKGGIVSDTIALSAQNSGAFAWNVPSFQAVGTDYRIRVASASNGSVFDESDGDFSIVSPPPPPPVVLGGLSISGPASVPEGTAATYTAAASWSDGSTSPVTPVWSVSPTTFANINAAGVLTTLEVPSDQSVTVSASYTFDGVTESAQQAVVITDVPAQEDLDGDGVPDTEEMGPEGTDVSYDGNQDGLPDGQQDNVASLHTFDGGHYVTLESPGKLSDVMAVALPAGAPSDVSFPYGIFSFAMDVPAPGAPVILRILLDGISTDTYYKFGGEPGDPVPHWYEFLPDSVSRTGAEFPGPFEIVLHLADGDRGDDDLTADGTITDQGGPGIVQVPPPPPQVSAGGGGCTVPGGQGGRDFHESFGSGAIVVLAFVLLAIRGRPRKRR